MARKAGHYHGKRALY